MTGSLEGHIVGLDDPDNPLDLATIAAVIERGREPDWAAAESVIETLPNNLQGEERHDWLSKRTGGEELDEGETVFYQNGARQTLADFLGMWEQKAGDRFFMVDLPESVALVAFGFHVGNSLDVYDVVWDLQEAGLLRAAGYANEPEVTSGISSGIMPMPRR